MTYNSNTVVVNMSGLVKLFFKFSVFSTRPDGDQHGKLLIT